jgi:hypothetical protein
MLTVDSGPEVPCLYGNSLARSGAPTTHWRGWTRCEAGGAHVERVGPAWGWGWNQALRRSWPLLQAVGDGVLVVVVGHRCCVPCQSGGCEEPLQSVWLLDLAVILALRIPRMQWTVWMTRRHWMSLLYSQCCVRQVSSSIFRYLVVRKEERRQAACMWCLIHFVSSR